MNDHKFLFWLTMIIISIWIGMMVSSIYVGARFTNKTVKSHQDSLSKSDSFYREWKATHPIQDDPNNHAEDLQSDSSTKK